VGEKDWGQEVAILR